MKPHPRIRKTIKWGGAVVTVLLVVVWVGSGWGYAAWRGASGFGASIYAGRVTLTRQNDMKSGVIIGEGLLGRGTSYNPWVIPTGIWIAAKEPGRMDGKTYFRLRSFGDTSWSAPLWPLMSALILVAVCLWIFGARGTRHIAANLCPKCNYDRTGLAAGAVCPECGRLPT